MKKILAKVLNSIIKLISICILMNLTNCENERNTKSTAIPSGADTSDLRGKDSEKSIEEDNEDSESESLSFGEIRGRLIGGNLRLLNRELGEPTYSMNATSFIEQNYGTSIPLGLYDYCLGFEVYCYENYFGESEHLLVCISEESIVTNVIQESEVQDIKDICCCN